MAECSDSVVLNNVNTEKTFSVVHSGNSEEENNFVKVMEPILLEDFKYNQEPKSLLNLLEYFEINHVSPNKTDIVVGLVYILMLESGFVPTEQRNSCEDFTFNYKRILEFSKQLPNNWKKNNLYSFSFILPPFHLYECVIACFAAADDILLNCIVKGLDNGQFSTLIDPLTYFLSSTTRITTNIFQNLSHLSRIVKSEVCYPAKQKILRENNVVVNCIEHLPPEIIVLIMSYLKIEDLVHLGQLNSYFYEIMKTPELWIRRIKIDFDENFNQPIYELLRDRYKCDLHSQRVRYKERAYLTNRFFNDFR